MVLIAPSRSTVAALFLRGDGGEVATDFRFLAVLVIYIRSAEARMASR